MTQASDIFPDPRVVELVEAAMAGDRERARSVVASGVSVDARGRQYVTPLLWAVAHDNPGATAILLELGADTRAIDERGRSVMRVATTLDRPDVLGQLLSAGGDPNDRTPAGQPLLFVAIERLAWEHLDALLDAGADIDATDPRRMTPILLLAMLNQYEQVAKLIQRGAKLDVANEMGRTLAGQVKTGIIDPDSPDAPWREVVRRMLQDRGIEAG